MKNFARIIELEEVECIVRRVGGQELYFDFWLRTEDSLTEAATITCPSAIMEQPCWVLDALFAGGHENEIKKLAEDTYTTMRKQLNLLEDGIVLDKSYSFTGPSLDLLRPPREDF